MTTSVCMGIYNGEKYIEKQLRCILEQSMPADEVVLCDDASTDRTVFVVEEFIRRHHLEETWKLYKNVENKGYPGNFYYAMSLCTGDIVFLADQDDLWEKEKLEKMTTLMNKEERIQLLSSKWGLIDEHDEIIKKVSSGKASKEEKYEAVTLEDILYYYDWPGMTMCYRREFGEMVLECVSKSKLAHDLALAVMAVEKEEFYCVNQVYQYHRRHEANVAMEEHRVRKLLNKKRKMNEIERYLEKMQQILEFQCLSKEENINKIRNKNRLMEERLDNLRNGKKTKIFKQFLENPKEVRMATMLCDWLICKQ